MLSYTCIFHTLMLISAQLFNSLYGEVEHVNCQCSNGSIHGNCVNVLLMKRSLKSKRGKPQTVLIPFGC